MHPDDVDAATSRRSRRAPEHGADARQRRTAWLVVAGSVLVALVLALVVRLGPGAGRDDAAVRVPRGGQDAVELVLDAQAARVRVEAVGDGDALLEARGSGTGADARHTADGARHELRVTGDAAVVRLARDVTWTLRIAVGADDAVLDLSGLTPARLDVAGGAGAVELRLPAPEGVVPAVVAAGVDRLEVQVPAGTAVRTEVGAGVGTAVVDGRSTQGVGPGTTLTTGDAGSGDRWDVELAGGAGTLVLGDG